MNTHFYCASSYRWPLSIVRQKCVPFSNASYCLFSPPLLHSAHRNYDEMHTKCNDNNNDKMYEPHIWVIAHIVLFIHNALYCRLFICKSSLKQMNVPFLLYVHLSSTSFRTHTAMPFSIRHFIVMEIPRKNYARQDDILEMCDKTCAHRH